MVLTSAWRVALAVRHASLIRSRSTHLKSFDLIHLRIHLDRILPRIPLQSIFHHHRHSTSQKAVPQLHRSKYPRLQTSATNTWRLPILLRSLPPRRLTRTFLRRPVSVLKHIRIFSTKWEAEWLYPPPKAKVERWRSRVEETREFDRERGEKIEDD